MKNFHEKVKFIWSVADEGVYKYSEREVRPYMPDARINEKARDHKDGEIGRVGYEINFNRYFYRYQPPRPLEEIEADTKMREMLQEVTG